MILKWCIFFLRRFPVEKNCIKHSIRNFVESKIAFRWYSKIVSFQSFSSLKVKQITDKNAEKMLNKVKCRVFAYTYFFRYLHPRTGEHLMGTIKYMKISIYLLINLAQVFRKTWYRIIRIFLHNVLVIFYQLSNVRLSDITAVRIIDETWKPKCILKLC